MDRNEIEQRIKIMENAAAQGMLTSDELEDLWFKRMILALAGKDVDVPAIEPKPSWYESRKAADRWIAYDSPVPPVIPIPDTQPIPTILDEATEVPPVQRPRNGRVPIIRANQVINVELFNRQLVEGVFVGRNLAVLNRWTDDSGVDTVEIEYND